MNEQEALPGVLLYYHLYPTVFAKVSADECQLLVQAIFSTGGVCEMPELDKNLDIVWGLIRRMLDNNQASYQQKVKQSSAAGKKGVQKREENREKQRQEIIERAQAEEKALDDQAQQGSLNALNDNGDYQQAQQAQQAKSKSNDKSKSTSKSNNKITNAHRLTPIMGAWQRPAQLPLRLCARFCQAMCAAFLARRSKPKHP